MPAVVPNGIITGLDIGLSNTSLVFITMSFYTMCKATVPVFLLFFAFLWGIERWVSREGLAKGSALPPGMHGTRGPWPDRGPCGRAWHRGKRIPTVRDRQRPDGHEELAPPDGLRAPGAGPFILTWRPNPCPSRPSISRPSWSLVGVVGVIVGGLTLLVKGESEFDGLGFGLVMTASCLSGLRFTLMQVRALAPVSARGWCCGGRGGRAVVHHARCSPGEGASAAALSQFNECPVLPLPSVPLAMPDR